MERPPTPAENEAARDAELQAPVPGAPNPQQQSLMDKMRRELNDVNTFIRIITTLQKYVKFNLMTFPI